jgi:hypothetical protein
MRKLLTAVGVASAFGVAGCASGPPVVVEPAPYALAPAPVVVAPPPRYVAPPPPPYVAPAPVYYAPAPRCAVRTVRVVRPDGLVVFRRKRVC